MTEHLNQELGAKLVAGGVEFTVFSSKAEAVEVCLFSAEASDQEIARVRMKRDENDLWRAFVPNLKEGALYGYRAYGLWAPQEGHFFNPRKLLVDPYAKALHGSTLWHPSFDNFDDDYQCQSLVDSGHDAPKSVVVNSLRTRRPSPRLQRPWSETLVYEMHVKGFSMQNEEIPEALRGTYAGLAHPSSLAYLQKLGITAVQLLPVHWHLEDAFLLKKGLTNYWGYNTLNFFAPHPEYAVSQDPIEQIGEFQSMVDALHDAGIEVLLDVVYNHTAEGGVMGTTLSFRGLDHAAYYLLNKDCMPENYTGCGNTCNLASPTFLRLTLDSLRYWVEVMGVDGFRFDLGVTMGRIGEVFAPNGPFFMAVQQDPVLRDVKMIAEPWDMGPQGYQVGGFPRPWRELNGRYRDDVRRFWCGDPVILPDFAKRFSGSEDIYAGNRRGPLSSVNFLTSHDGFTLRDLWTYHDKQNLANGEDNRDGDNQNHSWNAGVEGETSDPEIQELRQKLTRASLTTLILSKGVPFITAGDERFRTQNGNNNAYCQDNPLSWMHWALNAREESLFVYVQRLIEFRKNFPLWSPGCYFDGKWDPIRETHDILWFDQENQPMTSEKWHDKSRRFVAAQGGNRAENGPSTSVAMSWWLLFNGSDVDCDYPIEGEWELKIDSARGLIMPNESVMGTYRCGARSVVCLVQQKKVHTNL